MQWGSIWSDKDVVGKVLEHVEPQALAGMRLVSTIFNTAVSILWKRQRRCCDAPDWLSDGAALMCARKWAAMAFELPDAKGKCRLSWTCEPPTMTVQLHYQGPGAECLFLGGLTRNRLQRDESLQVQRVVSDAPYVLEDLKGASFGGRQGQIRLVDGQVVSKQVHFDHWVKMTKGNALTFATFLVEFAEPRFRVTIPIVIASCEGIPIKSF